MSGDSPNNNNPSSEMYYQRRSSITSATFSNLFQRRNSASAGTAVFPGPIASAALGDQRRRLSITTLGLSGTSPTNPPQFANARRGSVSTSSDAIEESAFDDEEALPARTAPSTPFTRRMSFGAQTMRNIRSPGAGSPNPNDQGFNWSEQLRSRAESSVSSGPRTSFSFSTGMNSSPPRMNGGGGVGGGPQHNARAKSVSDMPAPPSQTPRPRQPQKPDHFQERILKGDFYMD